jgi:hypothetical protein
MVMAWLFVFHCANIVNPICIQQLTEIILSSTKTVLECANRLPFSSFTKSRLVTLVEVIHAFVQQVSDIFVLFYLFYAPLFAMTDGFTGFYLKT